MRFVIQLTNHFLEGVVLTSVRMSEGEGVKKRIADLVQDEDDTRIQIWILVRLGGQHMTEVARAYGYRDGSGVHQVVRRLEARAKNDRQLRKHLQHFTKETKEKNV